MLTLQVIKLYCISTATRLRKVNHDTCTCTVEPFYCGYRRYRNKCPDYRGVLISEVLLYTKAPFGTPESVLIVEVSLL